MKRLFVIPTLLVLALALVSMALGSPTASAARPLTGSGSFSEAHASFFSEADGVQTSTFVDAHDDAFSDPFGGTFEGSSVFIFISQFNPGNPGNPGDDVTRNFDGVAELAPDQFQVSADLGSATLNAVVTVCERPSGACFDVTVNLTWAGTGDAHNNSGVSNQRIDRCRIHSTFSGSFRDATATGTVSDGSTDFVSGPSDFAQLSTFSFKDRFVGDCSFLFPPPPGP